MGFAGLYRGITPSGAGAAVSSRAPDFIEMRDEKSAGTDGGSFTSGDWRTRTLNTEHADTGGHASLSSNQITLAAGTYEVEIICPAVGVDSHQAKLRNISDSTDTLVGSTSYCGSGSTQATHSFGHRAIHDSFSESV